MLLLEAHQLKLYVKDRLLMDVPNLQIHRHDRIGLIGRNGSGKTTLLNILAGKQPPEHGKVIRYATHKLLPQLKRMDTMKSGGEVTQEYIVDAIAENPEILFADEPTTNLDTEHIEWLEKSLKNWRGAYVIVSHDRAFLDSLCTKIWEINEGRLNEFKGNYSSYERQKERMLREQKQAYEKYVQKKEQLKEALKLKEKKANRATKKPKKVSASESKITGAKPYFAKKQKKLQQTAKAIQTRLDKLEKVEKPKEVEPIKMSLPHIENIKGRIIIRVQDVSAQFGERMLWKPASFSVKGGDKLAIIGANGSGKTTLIKKLIQQDEGIILSPAIKIGYFSQHGEELLLEKSILENVSITSNQDETLIRTVLARLHFFRDDVYKPIHVLSGGERVKVALAKLLVSDVNTLVLDEPTNFLDIEAVKALESLIKEYEGSVIFVSHDRRFIRNLATRIGVIAEKKITLFEGTYEEYQQIKSEETQNAVENQRLVLETKISEVLSRLSLEPSEELEKEYRKLLTEKRKLNE